MAKKEGDKKHRVLLTSAVLLVLIIVFIFLDLSWATWPLSMSEVWDVFMGRGTRANNIIVIKHNLPRVVAGISIGAGLAVSGAIMQALFRNPMASPYILGLSSGASFGASIGMLFAIPFIPAVITTPLLAFVTCFLTMMLVYSLSRVGGKTQTETLLLSGIAVGAFLSALVSFLTYIAGDKMADVVFWSMGSLSRVTMDQLAFVIPMIVVGLVIMLFLSRDLNAMMLGDAHAMDLGVDVKNVRFVLLVCATMVTASSVAFAGVIGFVGLVIPHIIRLLVGPDNRKVIPLSIVGGSTYMIACDYVAHAVSSAVGVLPIGIITAMIGGPYFIYLLRRRKNQVGWN